MDTAGMRIALVERIVDAFLALAFVVALVVAVASAS
jgi:hypothetical protein